MSSVSKWYIFLHNTKRLYTLSLENSKLYMLVGTLWVVDSRFPPSGVLFQDSRLLCLRIFGQIAVEDPYILLHMHQRIPRTHQPWLTWRKMLSCNWLWCMSKRIKESCFKEAPYQKNLLHNMLNTSKIQERETIWNTEPKPDSPSGVPPTSRSGVLTRWPGGIRLAVAHHIE